MLFLAYFTKNILKLRWNVYTRPHLLPLHLLRAIQLVYFINATHADQVISFRHLLFPASIRFVECDLQHVVGVRGLLNLDALIFLSQRIGAAHADMRRVEFQAFQGAVLVLSVRLR